MARNFYDEKIAEIKKLSLEKKYLKAYTILMEELNMPYIPIKYEQQFLTFKAILESELIQKNDIANDADPTSLVQMLFDKNEATQTIALQKITKINLRPYVAKIKERIESWSNDENIKKAILFEILSEQEIDINLRINDKLINPLHNSIFRNQATWIALSTIKEIIPQNPQLLANVDSELKRYLLLIFPNFIKNGKEVANQIVNIVSNMMGINVILSIEEQKIKEILTQH